MSSFVGHIVAAAAVGRLIGRERTTPLSYGILALAALSPDFDYISLWLFGVAPAPRITHSIGFILMMTAIYSATRWALQTPSMRMPSPATFFAAGFSHLVLDALVGVHPSPWAWPLSSQTFGLPFGFLPSAGQLDPRNIYLWRNLTIEMGVLLPATALLARWREKQARTRLGTIALLIVLAAFIALGNSLSRQSPYQPTNSLVFSTYI